MLLFLNRNIFTLNFHFILLQPLTIFKNRKVVNSLLFFFKEENLFIYY